MAAPFETPIAPGLDRRPFVEVGDYNYQDSVDWSENLAYLALSGIGIYGIRWGLNNIKIKVDPNKHLRYLTEGFAPRDGGTAFRQVAGYGAEGTVKATLGDLLAEKIKAAEEMAGGLPRTFGLADAMMPSVLTKPTSYLEIPAEHVRKARGYYKALLGRDLAEEELKRGFIVKGFKRKQLEGAFGKEEAKKMLKAGTATPGRGLGLFVAAVEEKGGEIKKVAGDLVLPDVGIRGATWAPEDVPEGARQVFLSAQFQAEGMGVYFPVDEGFGYQITKTTGAPKLKGVYRDLAETFGLNIGRIERTAADHLTPASHKNLQTAANVGKSLAIRYFKILDQPLEFMEELMSRPDALGKLKGSSGYKLFRNIFGTGGDYTGGVADMTVRHVARIGTLGLGLSAAYEVGSRITDSLFDRDIAQMGGEVLGAAERVYAGASDVTGLTALNQYQEREAEGSQRLLGVLAFPISGYLTGRMMGAATNPLAKKSGEFGWRAARQEVHAAPGPAKALKALERVPGMGGISGPMTRGRMFGKVGGVIGGALSLPFLLGALGSERSHKEVVAEQTGAAEVAVRKGAMWEMGRSDIEGGRVQYYDEGWFARLMGEGAGELQYGEYEGRPVTRMIKSLIDPYWREKKYYHERPYPITGPDTSGFGPLGTIWGATIGRVLKPPKYMHADEASAGGYSGVAEGEIAQFGRSAGEAAVVPRGGIGPSLVRSPYDAGFLGGELVYKTTEAVGLPGFVFSSMKRALTGSQDFADQGPVLASFADVGSMRDQFWDQNLGGGYTTTEALRRFIPPERFQLQKVNPLANEMPGWMPGPDHYVDFRHGDPYGKIARGERRLPGSGYEDRFPELEGVDPEDYPNIFKYKILADVAPYSREFRGVSKLMAQQVAEGDVSERDYMIYKGTQRQLEEKSELRNFREEPENLSGHAVGTYWESLVSIGRMNPVEHLLPFSPVHKFAGPTDALQDYELNQIYSEENPYWGNPIEDFIAPAGRVGARALGLRWTPEALEEKRDLEGYFDKLEYTKFKRLQSQAEEEGLSQVAFAYGRRAESTMYGTDPYADVGRIKSVLPRSERGYFESFLNEGDPIRRREIMSAVPEYSRKFYTAQWNQQIYGEIMTEGPKTRQERQLVEQIERDQDFEGQPTTTGVISDFMDEMRSGNLTETEMPDYLRTRRLEPYFDSAAPYELPGDDWVGWDPSVSMSDVKLRVIRNSGMDHHDFDIWEEQVASARRKPYLDTAAEEVMYGGGGSTSALRRMLTSGGLQDVHLDVMHNTGTESRIMLEITRNRERDIRRSFEG